MLSVARTIRTSEQIRAEIEQTFSFLPPFFEPALASPQVLENLWQQTLAAYVENPLSALFKEKLNALLSRFCTAPYCMIVHSSALRPLGMTAPQVLALLEAPHLDSEAALPLGALPIPAPEEAASPAPDSPLETVLLYCATGVFLERADAPACQAELRRLLGPDLYPHLTAYLAYIKTCHTWIECHPDISYEADQRAVENLGPLLAEEPALADFFRHYQERVRAQGLGKERRRADDESLRAVQAQRTAILESITDGFHVVDREWRFTYLNAEAERLIFRQGHALMGKNIWDEFPEAVGSTFEREYRRAMAEQTPVSFEEFYPPLGAWLEVRAFPSPDGLSVFFRDVTEQAKRRQRERFLGELAERARALTDPEEVIADAVHSVGEFLNVSRCIFADIDIEADTCTIRPDYRAAPSSPSIEGVVSIASFGPYVVAEYAARRAVAVDDTHDDPIKAPPESVAAYDAIGIRAHVTVPVVHTGRVVSCMSVHNATPRHWEPVEIELLRSVVERTWLTVEVLRQQHALVREAEERRETHERTERVLDSITDAFFTLDRDYRFIFVNRQAEAIWNMSRVDLVGRSAWEVFPDSVGGVFYHQYHRVMESGVPESVEEFYPFLDSWLDVRAFPSEDGISVFFQNVSERKRAEDERERRLAEQRARAEREALLNRIGAAFRTFSNPDAIQEIAVTLLGEALGADRSYFVYYDVAENSSVITHDFHRSDLPTLQGRYFMSDFDTIPEELYRLPLAQVVPDVRAIGYTAEERAGLERLNLRAFVRVPLFSEASLVAVLAVSMADGPRDWTAEEVALVEAVAAQTRAAVDAAQASQRERRLLRDVLASVTEGHLLLCDTGADLPMPLTPVGEPIALSRTAGLRELRHLALEAAEGMAEELKHDLATSVSEAAMNAVVHGGGGTGQVWRGADGMVQVRVEDHGSGIAVENLPKATLARGFSTKATLGHGLKMMIETANRLYLLTGRSGTTVVLEQDRERPLPDWL